MHPSADPGRRNSRANARVALSLAILVAGMVAMAYAAVPLYRLFCQVTGYGGTTQRAEAASDTVLDRTITIRFDANVAGSLPWSFGPERRTMTLRIGETGQVAYHARNLGAAPTVGTSTFNVSPPAAGIYFNKIECFCFTEQPLAPGEDVDMPVVFFVDPAIVEDKNARGIGEITLSYTFYPVTDGSADRPYAAASDDRAAPGTGRL
ncbi:cytochrome c oxidase assembly protein [Tepidamorphus gemmatus]